MPEPSSRWVGFIAVVTSCAALLGLAACEQDDPSSFFPDASDAGSGGSTSGGTGGVSTGGMPGGGGAPNTGGSESGGEAGVDSGGAAGDGATGGAGGVPAAGGSGGSAEPVTLEIVQFEDTWVDSCEPEDVNGAAMGLLIDADPCVYEVYLKPVSLSAIPAGATVQSATLTLNCLNAGAEVAVFRAGGAWSESELSWDDRPELGTLLGSFTPALGAVELDLTEQAQAWVSGSPLDGIVLTTESVNGSDYSSSEASFASQRPRLSITYVP
jgi:hypothetical protein